MKISSRLRYEVVALVCAGWTASATAGASLAAAPTYQHDVATGVARYRPDGAPDRSFNSNGVVAVRTPDQTFANAVAIQPDNKIVVVGATSNVSSGEIGFVVARYNPDGASDATFASNGASVTRVAESDAEAHAVALQADGKIVVAGTLFATTANRDQIGVARYNPDGSLDASFGTAGVAATRVGVASAEARGLALQTDGKIVVAGTAFANGPTDDDFALVRLHPDGTLDRSFGAGGVVTTDFGGLVGASESMAPLDRANAVAIQSDGRIVVVGVTHGASSDFAVARYNADGSLDTTFGSNAKASVHIGTASEAFALALQPDGRIVVAGSATFDGSDAPFAVARLRDDGSLDSTFGSSGYVTTVFEGGSSGARAVVIQPDGLIVVAGGGYGVAPDSNIAQEVQNGGFALVRYQPDGAPDTSFGMRGRVLTTVGDAGAAINGLGLQPDGRIVAAGLVSFRVR